jgi:signal transduction histidine kinase
LILRAWVDSPFAWPRRILISVLCSLLITLPVLLFVYHQTDRLLEARIAARLDDRELGLRYGYKTGGIPGVVQVIRNEMETGILSGGTILLVDPSGLKLAGNLASWPPTLRQPTRWTEIRLYPERQTQPQLFAIRVVNLPGGYHLLIGTNLETRERMRASLIEALFGAMLLAIPLGMLFGVFLLRVAERGAGRIGRVAERIAAGDFTQRLSDEDARDFPRQVADAVNAMLARIEELVEQLRVVTDALAHDLRSPLTRMRANIEKAAAHSCDDVQQQALEAVGVDIDRLLRVISATLEISRTEAGVGRQQFEEFEIPGLLRDICEIYEPLADEQQVALNVHQPGSLSFFGNRQLIGRAVANLIDNALKYAGAGKAIDLGARETDGRIELWVADHGPGIPPELRTDALTKYGRLEEARTTEGVGLGLAFVRAVARLHGGDIELGDNDPGLKVLMTLRREP